MLHPKMCSLQTLLSIEREEGDVISQPVQAARTRNNSKRQTYPRKHWDHNSILGDPLVGCSRCHHAGLSAVQSKQGRAAFQQSLRGVYGSYPIPPVRRANRKTDAVGNEDTPKDTNCQQALGSEQFRIRQSGRYPQPICSCGANPRRSSGKSGDYSGDTRVLLGIQTLTPFIFDQCNNWCRQREGKYKRCEPRQYNVQSLYPARTKAACTESQPANETTVQSGIQIHAAVVNPPPSWSGRDFVSSPQLDQRCHK